MVERQSQRENPDVRNALKRALISRIEDEMNEQSGYIQLSLSGEGSPNIEKHRRRFEHLEQQRDNLEPILDEVMTRSEIPATKDDVKVLLEDAWIVFQKRWGDMKES